jgi:hypothetical protein
MAEIIFPIMISYPRFSSQLRYKMKYHEAHIRQKIDEAKSYKMLHTYPLALCVLLLFSSQLHYKITSLNPDPLKIVHKARDIKT